VEQMTMFQTLRLCRGCQQRPHFVSKAESRDGFCYYVCASAKILECPGKDNSGWGRTEEEAREMWNEKHEEARLDA
jgi:hypothetical protein